MAEGGSEETSTKIQVITPSDLSLPRDPGMEGESFGFSLGFPPRHYWQRMPGWEQASRTLTRDYTFDINRTSNSESTHNLRLRVALLSVPRERRRLRGQAQSPATACRLTTAGPCLPGTATRPGMCN